MLKSATDYRGKCVQPLHYIALGLPKLPGRPKLAFPPHSITVPPTHPSIRHSALSRTLIVFRHGDALLAAALTMLNHYINWKGFLIFYGY